MSFIFNAPFLLILYFLDFLNSLLSLVHMICALKSAHLKRRCRESLGDLGKGTHLSNFLTGQRILMEGRALEHLRKAADLEVHLRVQVRLIVSRVLAGDDGQGTGVHFVASPGVAGLLRGRLLRRALAVLSALLPSLCHYLLASHFTFLHAPRRKFSSTVKTRL